MPPNGTGTPLLPHVQSCPSLAAQLMNWQGALVCCNPGLGRKSKEQGWLLSAAALSWKAIFW